MVIFQHYTNAKVFSGFADQYIAENAFQARVGVRSLIISNVRIISTTKPRFWSTWLHSRSGLPLYLALDIFVRWHKPFGDFPVPHSCCANYVHGLESYTADWTNCSVHFVPFGLDDSGETDKTSCAKRGPKGAWLGVF
jgi:hypothetical protein